MLTSDQTYKRKLQEAYLALQLENVVSKDTILRGHFDAIVAAAQIDHVQVLLEDGVLADYVFQLKEMCIRDRGRFGLLFQGAKFA